MKLVFATHNPNKVKEVVALLPSNFELLSLTDIQCLGEIPETGDTLLENAKIKADHVTKTYGLDCFSDDTGLHINALKGAPGIYSARYAGNHKSADNISKVLSALGGVKDRSAFFKTVIYLNLNGTSHVFKGIVKGTITEKEQGDRGFGYDPIFKPKGCDKTFGELSEEGKNMISHRALAIQNLVEFLKKHTF